MKQVCIGLFFLFSLNSFAGSYPTNELKVDSNEFLSVLFEEQKTLYKKGDWDRFFSNALFYRYHFLLTKEKREKYFIEEMITLEILAYAKNCQWEEVGSIIKGVNEFSSEADQKKMEILKAKINLLKAVPLTKIDEKPVVESNKVLWALETNKITQIKHPKEIIVKVENKCAY